jgi:hypothetical protein
MFKDVRSTPNAPIVADFTAATGTPIVVNMTTGQPFVYVNGSIAPLGTVNVKGFGAKGDGVTDDSAAFNAATAASQDVYVPAGTYMVKDVRVFGDATLRGAGMERTILKASGNCTNAVVYGYNPRFRVENMTINGNATGGYTNIGVLSDGTVTDFANFSIEFERLEILNCGSYGMKLMGANIPTIRNCAFNDCGNTELYLDSCHWFRVVGCDFEQSSAGAIDVVNVTSHGGLAPGGGIIESNWFEALEADYAITTEFYNVAIRNNKFLVQDVTTATIRVKAGADYTTIEQNNFQDGPTNCVQVDATAVNTYVGRNRGITTYAGSTTPGLLDNGTATVVEGSDETANSAVRKATSHSFSDKSGACTWNSGYVYFGVHVLWVDATGRLRIKNGLPTSNTDGTVVGTQT